MLWLLDNSDPSADDGYKVHCWLKSHGIAFELLTDTSRSDALADKSAHLIISGGPRLLDQLDWSVQKRFYEFLDREMPTLGICLGCFILANLLGGGVEKITDEIHSCRVMRLHHGEGMMGGLMAGLLEDFNVAASHWERLSRTNWPSRLVIDGLSTRNEILSWHHETKPFYGVAFHPEHPDTKDGGRILLNFLKK